MKDGHRLESKAMDAFTSERKKREYLLIDNGRQQPIELKQYTKREVLTANAKFKDVSFSC